MNSQEREQLIQWIENYWNSRASYPPSFNVKRAASKKNMDISFKEAEELVEEFAGNKEGI